MSGQCPGPPACSPQTCRNGCCDRNGVCQPGNNATFCGTGGAQCVTCKIGQTCNQQMGQCEDRPGCGPENCDGCCDPATFAPNSVCRPGTTTALCGTGGANCVACRGATAICQNGQCLCTPKCQGKQCGDDGCGGSCGTCPSDQLCSAPSGQCQPRCHVCPTCRYTTVQAAVADGNGPSTIRICPGVYPETITIGRPLTLVGAGQGAGAGDTVLRGAGTTVVTINPGVGPVTLQSLRITGGNAANGGGVFHQGTGLTMTDCTVTGNTAQSAGGGVLTAHSSPLTMTGCTIASNQASNFGPEDVFGGGLSLGGNTTLANCTVSSNTTSGLGGGIALFALSGATFGTLTLNQTRVTGNAADDGGGGIYVVTGMVTLQNGSQVTGNTPDDCVGCG